jgi:hypothetical protein
MKNNINNRFIRRDPELEPKDNEQDKLVKRRATIANGIDNDEELEEDATENEIKEGNYTKVTKLVWDEYDPSEGEK